MFYGAVHDKAVAADIILETASGTYIGVYDRALADRKMHYDCYFAGGKVSNDFYSVAGKYSNSLGSVTYDGKTYDWALKMESNTSIYFETTEQLLFTFVLTSGGTLKIDGTKQVAQSAGVLQITLEPGAHRITKADSGGLFFINASQKNKGLIIPLEEQAIWSIRYLEQTETADGASCTRNLYPLGIRDKRFVFAKAAEYVYRYAK